MNYKHKISLTLILTFILNILIACNSSKNTYSDIKYTNVYRTQYLDMPEGYTYDSPYLLDDKIYVKFSKITRTENIDDGTVTIEIDNILYIYDINGDVSDIISLNFDILKNRNYNLIPSNDNTFYIVDTETIQHMTDDGILIWELSFEESFNIKPMSTPIPIQIYCDEEYLYILNRQVNPILFVITTTGRPVNYIKINDYIKSSDSLVQMNIAPDNKIIFTFEDISGSYIKNNTNRYKYYAVDEQKKNIVEYEMPKMPDVFDARTRQYFDADYSDIYDIYYSSNDGLYGYTIGTDSIEMLVNWANSGIAVNFQYFMIISIIKPDLILCMINDIYSPDISPKLALLKRIPDDEVTPKTMLTIATLDKNDDLIRTVVMFNKQSDKYTVFIQDYSVHDTTDNFRRGEELFNVDIASGVVYDMVFLNNIVPIDSYIAKGMFVDLYKLFDADTDISRDNVLGIIKSKYETNGCLYILPLSYFITTLLSKQSLTGAKESLTVNEIIEINNILPPNVSLFTYSDRERAFSYMLQAGASNYIDYKNGKCNFGSADFIKMIEFANTLPNISYANNYRLSETEIIEAIRSEDIYFYELLAMDIAAFINMKYYYGNDEYVIKGFPTQTGNGTIAQCYNYIGITDKSESKVGAWEFIKYWLSDEVQLYQKNFTLPITNSALNNILNEYMNKYYYTNQSELRINDKPLSKNIIESLNYKEFHFTEEDATKICRFFNNIQVTPKYDNTVISIIWEEIHQFFADKITAEQCAHYIQNRVSTYLNEQK